jgi:hypothetical protein
MNRLSLLFVEDSGAIFSDDRKYRFALWRIWDRSLPLVAFMGLNPSTANETDADPTIRSVGRIAKHNGYGGIVMINVFPMVSTDPALLDTSDSVNNDRNQMYVNEVVGHCSDVVFAWGSFSVVKESGMDALLTDLFPDAKCLHINKNGSPKHPLYCKSTSSFIDWKLQTVE